MTDSNFVSQLIDTYIKDPCRVLPNALWKTLDRLGKLDCSLNQTGNTKCIDAWDNNGLHIFWNEDRFIDSTTLGRVENSNFVIIHDDYIREINTNVFSLIKSYFRIKYEPNGVQQYSLNERFSVLDVEIESEIDKVSELIGKCYKDIHPSVEAVRGWTRSRVFDKSLWIWVMDNQINIPVALGIAELDRDIFEGSLEWIQVLPEYQGNGLGKVLVMELLNRMDGRVRHVTVSGEVDNETNPERLYRRCGFYGDDVWWLMRK
jgi:ribosomal protein S18 acetylase RimI-like enzyme